MFGANATSVSLNPRQEDHSGSQFWKRSYWAAYRNGSRINDTDMAALSLFMEDGAGNPIPEEAKNDLRDAVYGFWREMIEKKEKPTVYKDASYRTREDFRVTMEGKFPWLRLCDGHWKVKQVWKNCFATWKKSNMPDEASPATKTRTMKAIHTAPTDQDNPEAKTIIEIVSSDDNSSAGSKRRREDNSDAVSSKKHKGKGPANIHPAQSRPKKLKGKAINVSTSLIPFDARLLRDTQEVDPLYLSFFRCICWMKLTSHSQCEHKDHNRHRQSSSGSGMYTTRLYYRLI